MNFRCDSPEIPTKPSASAGRVGLGGRGGGHTYMVYMVHNVFLHTIQFCILQNISNIIIQYQHYYHYIDLTGD